MLPRSRMLTIKNWGALSACLMITLSVWVLGGCSARGPQALLEGGELIKQGKFPQAIARLQIAVEAMPDNAQAWNHLGLAYHGAGRPAEALQAYKKAIQRDPKLV